MKAGMSIYDPKVALHFFQTEKVALEPHIFRVAAEAYSHIVGFGEDSCIIITGESGAGKTETAKHVLQFVANVSYDSPSRGRHRFGERRVEHVKAKLLQSSPLLEALGNAQTSRNDNSSRFGKYLEMQFDLGGGVIGGRVTNFLLEKSRVVQHAPNERSFHIFYMWCAGAFESDVLSRGAGGGGSASGGKNNTAFERVRGAESYRYLMNELKTIPGVDDAATGKEVRRKEEEEMMMMRFLSSVVILCFF
jgi:myosin-1